ncbi:MAG: archease [Deltaproteobacteria bacterium]
MTRYRHRLLPHTADLMVEVRGKDLPDLCAAGVLALFSLLTDRRSVRQADSRVLAAEAPSPEDRFFFLLREALLLFEVDRFLVRRAHGTMEGNRVALTVRGEPADPSRHAFGREIKAVTRHALTVAKRPGGFAARFVVDV